jgi:hypothetical protein
VSAHPWQHTASIAGRSVQFQGVLPSQRRCSRRHSTSGQRDRPLGQRDRQSTRPAYSCDQHGRTDEVANCHRLRQAVLGRGRDRPLQIDHRTQAAGTLILSTTNRSCHRPRRPQPNAGMCTPEVRPVRDNNSIVTASKIRIHLRPGAMQQSLAYVNNCARTALQPLCYGGYRCEQFLQRHAQPS